MTKPPEHKDGPVEWVIFLVVLFWLVVYPLIVVAYRTIEFLVRGAE